jgi:hypothetical protein
MAIAMENLNNPTPEVPAKPEPIKEQAPAPSVSASNLRADEIFGMMKTYLSEGLGKPLVPKVAAIFGFDITKTKGGKVEASYEIDLKNGQGNVKKGKPEKADATFTMTDEDFE